MTNSFKSSNAWSAMVVVFFILKISTSTLIKSPGRLAADAQNAINLCPDTLRPHGELPLATEFDNELDAPVSFCGCNPDNYLFKLPSQLDKPNSRICRPCKVGTHINRFAHGERHCYRNSSNEVEINKTHPEFSKSTTALPLDIAKTSFQIESTSQNPTTASAKESVLGDLKIYIIATASAILLVLLLVLVYCARKKLAKLQFYQHCFKNDNASEEVDSSDDLMKSVKDENHIDSASEIIDMEHQGVTDVLDSDDTDRSQNVCDNESMGDSLSPMISSGSSKERAGSLSIVRSASNTWSRVKARTSSVWSNSSSTSKHTSLIEQADPDNPGVVHSLLARQAEPLHNVARPTIQTSTSFEPNSLNPISPTISPAAAAQKSSVCTCKLPSQAQLRIAPNTSSSIKSGEKNLVNQNVSQTSSLTSSSSSDWTSSSLVPNASMQFPVGDLGKETTNIFITSNQMSPSQRASSSCPNHSLNDSSFQSTFLSSSCQTNASCATSDDCITCITTYLRTANIVILSQDNNKFGEKYNIKPPSYPPHATEAEKLALQIEVGYKEKRIQPDDVLQFIKEIFLEYVYQGLVSELFNKKFIVFDGQNH